MLLTHPVGQQFLPFPSHRDFDDAYLMILAAALHVCNVLLRGFIAPSKNRTAFTSPIMSVAECPLHAQSSTLQTVSSHSHTIRKALNAARKCIGSVSQARELGLLLFITRTFPFLPLAAVCGNRSSYRSGSGGRAAVQLTSFSYPLQRQFS